ncbi:MAG: Gfo/Idh/MocA family oxidoreductase [Gemmataceae bacterium]|nr:Gfo/Idh/MocA family oxidoreductase [Gemmataceae bacterium]MDW8266492.1 Gfo/Idh/MocA family oxidoreductase [Gemmataceae bacterium]
MAIDVTPEQREIGKANFHRVVGGLAQAEPTRRDFMKGMLAGAAALPIGAAAYFGYNADRLDGRPVRTALIGAGDEGGVLVGEHNPRYLEIVAVCDIRPSNQKRIFKGEGKGPRWGLEHHYGRDAAKKIKLYTNSYKEMLEDASIEAVIIALPLHLHAPVAIDCMKAGKHVLCEKLMAWNVSQCKEMIRVARQTNRVLSIGHQRHYSLLYAHAVEVLRSGVLGDVKHIRAQWHRNNTWPLMVKDKDGRDTDRPVRDAHGRIVLRDSWCPPIPPEDREALEKRVAEFGYKSIEELVRWRLFNRTGGGLMAELGSHQLDACSIFLGKVRPLAVSGIGTRSFYREQYRNKEREVEDHVFVTFEFPGPNYRDDCDDVVIVTYSSISTNAFEPYGECVMGTRGTMIVSMEQEVMLWPERGGPTGRSTAVGVAVASGNQPVLDTSASTGPGATAAQSLGQQALGSGPVSRGYREEMEDFAYCIRLWDDKLGYEKDSAGNYRQRLPRCHGEVALADAVVALTSNLAMRGTKASGHRPQRIDFQPSWFDPDSNDVPDAEMVPEPVTV